MEPEDSLGLQQVVAPSRLNSLWLVYTSGAHRGSAVPDAPAVAGCDADARFAWFWSISPAWSDVSGCGAYRSSCAYRVVDAAALGATFEVSVIPSALEGGARVYSSLSAAEVRTVASFAP